MSPGSALPPAAKIGGRHAAWLWVVLVAAVALGFIIDGPVMAAARPLYHSDTAELINHTIRYLGTGYVQVPIALLMMAAGAVYGMRTRRAGAWMLVAFVSAGSLAHILKPIVHRARPYETDLAPERWIGYLGNSAFASFPSAEAATSFAVAVTLAAWYPRLRLPLILLAAVISVARVPVGAHHPSDVAAGALLGIAVGQLAISRAARGKHQQHASAC